MQNGQYVRSAAVLSASGLIGSRVRAACAELAHVFAAFAFVHGRNERVNSRTGDEVLLPCDLVRRMCLTLCTRAEADTGNTVAALNGNAVCGERPICRSAGGCEAS